MTSLLVSTALSVVLYLSLVFRYVRIMFGAKDGVVGRVVWFGIVSVSFYAYITLGYNLVFFLVGVSLAYGLNHLTLLHIREKFTKNFKDYIKEEYYIETLEEFKSSLYLLDNGVVGNKYFLSSYLKFSESYIKFKESLDELFKGIERAKVNKDLVDATFFFEVYSVLKSDINYLDDLISALLFEKNKESVDALFSKTSEVLCELNKMFDTMISKVKEEG